MGIVNFLKLIWLRVQQRGTLYASKNEQFDKLYQVSDPWRMGSELEQFRFQETNRIIEQELGTMGTLLEIGCGEGHQTEHLSRLCGQHYGFDVSKTAVDRARQRCPGARLSVADIFSYSPEVKKFDLVVACEVLYYIKDVPAALERMSELGSHCLVTYFQSGPCVLDAFFNDIEGAETRVIKVGDTSWKIVWWSSDHGGRHS